MSEGHRITHPVHLDDTDAAGVIHFTRLFVFAHHAYESLLHRLGLPVRKVLAEGEVFLPIVHAEADYRLPIRLGDELTLTLTLSRLGETSFTTRTVVTLSNGEEAGIVTLVHAAIDPRSGSKMRLPGELVDGLSPFSE